MNKIYHIYAKDKCLYHSLNEEEFNSIWSDLRRMVGIMKTEYSENDLSYEELIVNVNTNISLESSY